MRSGWNRIRIALVASLLTAVGIGMAGCHSRPGTATSTVFLVRHAEKEVGVQDPTLTEAGRARADALAHALADARIDAIYSTEFARTRRTAEAVAEVTGLEVRIFPVGGSGVDAFIEGLAQELRSQPAGRRILVVGHSNTVPALIRALGATTMADLTEQDYDDLFVVEFGQGGDVRLLQLHYGAPSP